MLTSTTTTSRIALGIEYNGANYHGWQSQDGNLITVQNTLEKALTMVADQPIKISCAGRTDVGVHATGQVIHFDFAPNSNKTRPLHAWLQGTNSYLPKDIRVQWAHEVPLSFHARFSATARHYRYIIYNGRAESALMHNRVLWYPWPLKDQAMQEAINHLLGEHDFSALRASSCQSLSTKRCVHLAKVEKHHDFIIIDIQANAFLHHMVRNIVGNLLLIGQNKKTPEWFKELLACRDRKQGGITAPATGLYLIAVMYPDIYQLPQTQKYPAIL
jgi:tRNA pseudouridine38-40 synthase